MDEDELSLFLAAMRDVAPLPASDKIVSRGIKVSPFPRKNKSEENATSENVLTDNIVVEIEAGDEWSFVQPGMPHQTLRRLRRGYWRIQDDLDLHGYTRDEARQALSVFLDFCAQQKFRCVRVIHGKGLSSKNREPVLKTRVGNWLMQRTDVLAFCQARPEDGGGGAILILLKTKV
ncbi:Smr/MutS family protein [Nitrosomonas ureae]|uniref:DNA-nicking endonuclease, Smr domain n=1 Tax=Nitrosomonas ureae TaxID=44577 RepID=A0A1H2DN36_9PROT|nr:Smr/MutS family protein [Nitrosomonas ureae]ALQ50755.1 DNA mismatch repair protein MutS [Nitrosomonas ureae]SDT84310.1 DNA-nicking endonuclease, Smr domain [Nitrosomonas ureae]